MNKEHKKGFTLIELLVVIAILAVLATAVVLIVNPAEFIRRSRDAQRVNDLGAINSAIALYLTDATTPDLDGSNVVPLVANRACDAVGGARTIATFAPVGFTVAPTNIVDNTTEVDGNGWVPVNIGSIVGGSPLSNFPVDPVNDGTHFYVYGCGSGTTLTYELNANLESARFIQSGADDKESNDGGSDNDWYEVGNDPGLDIIEITPV